MGRLHRQKLPAAHLTLAAGSGRPTGLASLHEKWAREQGGWDVRTYKGLPELLLELKAGRVDAIVVDNIPVMIVNFPRGKGEVFHAGSCEWVAGLLRQDPMVERVTQNVLDHYLGKS